MKILMFVLGALAILVGLFFLIYWLLCKAMNNWKG